MSLFAFSSNRIVSQEMIVLTARMTKLINWSKSVVYSSRDLHNNIAPILTITFERLVNQARDQTLAAPNND